MKTIFSLGLLAFVLAACDKDKFQTKPQLTVKSLSSDVVPFNGTLRVTLEFTDKEGDVSDSLILVRERLNARGRVRLNPESRIVAGAPAGTTQAEILLDMDYNNWLTSQLTRIRIQGTSNPEKYEPDTLSLKFVVRDAAGNKSDTAAARVVVIR